MFAAERGSSYSVVRKASKGEKATVYEEKNGWLELVQVSGFIMSLATSSIRKIKIK